MQIKSFLHEDTETYTHELIDEVNNGTQLNDHSN